MATRAAVYARKSTDDNDKAAQDKSVERQVAHARDYIARKGWSLSDEHIYVDDNVSGAEFKNRPGLLKLLDHLKEIDAIVMSEQSRLGREMSKTSAVLAKITARKVRIFFYLNDQELRFQSATDKFMVAAVAFANELERELASQRCRDAALKRAKEGRNFGGRVFGYENIWVAPDGSETPAVRGTRKAKDALTIYRINEREAEVVRAIFRMYVDGYGLDAIAKTLNRDPRYLSASEKYFRGVVPRAPYSRTGSWAPSSLHAMLHNPRYIGKIPFGKSRKFIDIEEGTKKRNWNTGEEQLFDAPDLRVVPDDLWRAVVDRQFAAQKTYLKQTNGLRWGRPGMARESRYLMTGFGRCGCCDSNIAMIGGKPGGSSGKQPIYYYGCSFYQTRGRSICSNDYRVRVPHVDEGVLDAIEQQILKPDYITYAVERAMALIAERRREQPDRPREIDAELTRVRRELRNLVEIVTSGRAPKTILEEIHAREVKAEELERELAALSGAATADQIDMARLRKLVREGAARFKDTLRADIPGARRALRQLLVEPLKFHPELVDGRKGFRFEGNTRIGPLFGGYFGVAPRDGLEPPTR